MSGNQIIKKVMLIILILFVIFSTVSIRSVYASNFISSGDDFISTGKDEYEQNQPIEQAKVRNLSKMIYNILLAIGTAIAVIVGLILGIQFMTGSVEQKSKIKESLIPYIAGCVVLFGAFGIWKLVVLIVEKI